MTSIFLLMLAPFLAKAFMLDFDNLEVGGRHTMTRGAKGSPRRRGLSKGSSKGSSKMNNDDDCYELPLELRLLEFRAAAVRDYQNATSSERVVGDTFYVTSPLYEPGTNTRVGNYMEISQFVPAGEAVSTNTYNLDYNEETELYESQFSSRRTRGGAINPIFAGQGRFENTYGYETELVVVTASAEEGGDRASFSVVICNN